MVNKIAAPLVGILVGAGLVVAWMEFRMPEHGLVDLAKAVERSSVQRRADIHQPRQIDFKKRPVILAEKEATADDSTSRKDEQVEAIGEVGGEISEDDAIAKMLSLQDEEEDAFANEMRDPNWAESAENNFELDFKSLLAKNGGLGRVTNVECRSSRCIVGLSWKSHADARALHKKFMFAESMRVRIVAA